MTTQTNNTKHDTQKQTYLSLRNAGSIIEEKINKNRLTVILKTGGELIFQMDKDFKRVVG